ncbi:16S rRNA (guanine(527)-N(7))-methyltransferase [Dehalogenimonas formicexedens]|uniref:Ribosomal RNA small subunit methyltransferase G n=1 Tax=Dehalogenimonas formicexedens TaxID=1839801 RepID=A0A1P8F769_9CHLR|nr:16S rRNA (guanine(527)-N(7))-methyltransferase RsmG [Dehalogenimonas formicexedens]APV44324.1 16S rRNA (guanine(527)-N(7))-methyltransferase [Dehalogenimonas formicexedens]
MILPTLRTGAEELGLRLSEEQFGQFEKYFHLLVEWNGRFNLTAVTDYTGVQTTHFLDSLSLVKSGIDFESLKVIDIGAGAGFPGLPLKVAFPAIKLILLEATGKKAVFLKETAAALGLEGVTVLNARAEDAARQPDYRERIDLAVSRAVASLDTLCELCLPFCRVGATFIAMKKGEIASEIEYAKAAIETLGGRLYEVKEISLAGLPDPRQLVIIEKIKRTPPEYPRRSGIPAKNPLR